MGASGFGPAPHINLDKSERSLREGVRRTGPDDAPSKLLAQPIHQTGFRIRFR